MPEETEYPVLAEKEVLMVREVNDISARGNSAEVKKDKDGNYVIYEVQKKKRKVG